MSEYGDLIGSLNELCLLVESAGLSSAAPELYASMLELKGTAFSLSVLDHAGHAEAVDAIVETQGFKNSARAAEFVARKIVEDEDLSKMLHKRICDSHKTVSVFSPEASGRLASNYVADFHRISGVLTEQKPSHFPEPDPNAEPVPGTVRYRPESEVFSGLLGELGNLKGKLATEGREI